MSTTAPTTSAEATPTTIPANRPTTSHRTSSPATARRVPEGTGAAAPEGEATAHQRPRLVQNVTRVTVAFPFATIRTTEPDVTHTLHELADIVAALAAEVDARRRTPATSELAERARALADSVSDG